MRFSLILATFGPAEDDLVRCLDSLVAQTLPDFEVILVDQNAVGVLDDLVARYRSCLALRHLRCEPGLSRARNAGLVVARGDIIGFPDDDCWYRPSLLADLAERFLNAPALSGFTGRCTNSFGLPSAGGDDPRSGLLTITNVWRRGVSATVFLRRTVFADIGRFDEDLGLGSGTVFRSGEETDLLLRGLETGHAMYYDASLEVYHPLPPPPGAPDATFRAWSYGLGMGRVLGKHGQGRLAIAYHVIYPLIGAAVAVVTGRFALARLRMARSYGRYIGWRWAPDRPAVVVPRWVQP